MAEQFGNTIPGPSYNEGPYIANDELLYSTVGLVQKGVTLKKGQGVLPLGTLLKQDTATKQYVKTIVPADAQGVLRQSTDTDFNGRTWQANIVYAGVLNLSKMTAANSGVALASVSGATVNTVAGFFKF